MTVLSEYLTASCQLGMVRYASENLYNMETDPIAFWTAAFWAGVKARERKPDVARVQRELAVLQEKAPCRASNSTPHYPSCEGHFEPLSLEAVSLQD